MSRARALLLQRQSTKMASLEKTLEIQALPCLWIALQLRSIAMTGRINNPTSFSLTLLHPFLRCRCRADGGDQFCGQDLASFRSTGQPSQKP